ncbi:MAG: ACT domain-containing protein [Lentisphaerae bacterium]|nr:ACT domain-containing protein [Lentisphaerota bacterium]
MIKKQFTVYLENKPGALAAVARRLAARKINLIGISAAVTADVGLVQIVAASATAARRELKAARLSFTEQDVLLVRLANRPGALADVATRIAKAGININYIYATAGDRGDGASYAVLSAPDLKRVQALLG